MKWTVVFILMSNLCFGQIKSLKPEFGRLLDFSPEGEDAFAKRQQKCAEIYKKLGNNDIESLSPEDRQLLNDCPEDKLYYDAEGPGCSWYCGGVVDSMFASSELPSNKQLTYRASNAHDLDFRTAWVEGKTGPGIGESITYIFPPENPRITTIKIANGYVKSEKAWRENSRVKKLKLYVNGNAYAILNLEDKRVLQIFTVGPFGHSDRINWDILKSQPPTNLRFEILEVYPGDKYEDTCISEIFFDGLDVHCLAANSLVLMADLTVKRIDRISKGEKVVSYDVENDLNVVSEVVGVYQAEHSELSRLVFEDGEIVITNDHPLWVQNKGWSAVNAGAAHQYTGHRQKQRINTLSVGDFVFLPAQHRYSRLLTIESVPNDLPTYTLRLKTANNFIANGVLVSAVLHE